jgi:hypothetical protein
LEVELPSITKITAGNDDNPPWVVKDSERILTVFSFGELMGLLEVPVGAMQSKID